jgi:hypothetical protein
VPGELAVDRQHHRAAEAAEIDAVFLQETRVA